jgi:catechol 2,3-dioxygenase-like lactoylglutathione lyase family enzyme
MRVNHVNIVVEDMERSLAFYVGLLGMRATFEAELSGEWIETVTGLAGVRARCVFCQPVGGGTRFELLEYHEPAAAAALPAASLPHTPGLRHVALEVEELDRLCERLRSAGVRFLSAPVQVPFPLAGNVHKRLCYLRDPDGVLVEIAEYVTASATPAGTAQQQP